MRKRVCLVTVALIGALALPLSLAGQARDRWIATWRLLIASARAYGYLPIVTMNVTLPDGTVRELTAPE